MTGLVVDLFAGGGGASTGLTWALGRDPDIAINHDPEALAMHKANHPDTKHLLNDITRVLPLEATAGRKVAILHASPDCTHFSKAKGGKPRSQHIRDLAWVVTRWAEDTRPILITLENVEEFLTWGPIDGNGQPIKSQAGETFRAWVKSLRRLGYQVSWKLLRACDYGGSDHKKTSVCCGQTRWRGCCLAKGHAWSAWFARSPGRQITTLAYGCTVYRLEHSGQRYISAPDTAG